MRPGKSLKEEEFEYEIEKLIVNGRLVRFLNYISLCLLREDFKVRMRARDRIKELVLEIEELVRLK